MNEVLITGSKDTGIIPIVAKVSDTTQFYNLQSNKMESFINWNRPEKSSAYNYIKLNNYYFLFNSCNSSQFHHLHHFSNMTTQFFIGM